MPIIFLYLLIPLIALLANDASAANAIDFGQVAVNILDPVSLLSDFISSACFVIGGSFLFASLIKYIEHRRSPLMVPISTVIFLLIAGIFLILLPFVALVTENGVHYAIIH